MTTPILRARGLEKRFGAVTALAGVDLDLERGKLLALLGPNGAGKTTLLRILAGLSHASAGQLEIGGQRSSRMAIGYLGHATLLYPELTARENLIFAGRLQRVAEPAARAETLLEEEGLGAYADRRTGDFSRGMAQRLSIARARVHDPELLLLDEPHTGLDRRSGERLSERLMQLRSGGHSLVLVTHDVEQAARLADQAVVLIAGRITTRVAGDALEPGRLDACYAAALDAAQ